MTSRTITRYRCDWCGTRAEVGHRLGMAPPLPSLWGRVELRGQEHDLCKLCVESLAAVLESGPDPSPPVPARMPVRHPAPRQLSMRLAGFGAALRRTQSAVRERVMVSVACAAVSLFAVVSVVAATGMPGGTTSTPMVYEPTSASETATNAAASDTGAESTTTTAPLAAIGGVDDRGAGATPDAGSERSGEPTSTPPGGSPVPASHALIDVRVTAIGDSVMLAAAEALRRDLDTIDVDAAVGRQATATLDVLRQRHAAGTLGSIVVLHVGNNGLIAQAQMDEMMQLLANVQTVLVLNLHIARAWAGPNNTMLGVAANRYANVTLVDWAGASRDRADLFWDDGVHPRPPGAELYAGLITRELQTLGQSAAVRQAMTGTPTLTPTPMAPPPTSSPTATPAAFPPTLVLTARVATRVTVTVDGRVAFSDVLAAGESRSWMAASNFGVATGNASGLLANINGYSAGTLAAAAGHPDWNTLDWTWEANWRPR